jgi:REP element-mobilizing transposase RayT
VPIINGCHHRGYLPHIKVSGATYFVTFRLADSLPRAVVLRLKEQRDNCLRESGTQQNGSRRVTGQAVLAWYAAEVDSVLDQHSGAAWMRAAKIAAVVANALRHFEGSRFQLPAWCVKPNHVHAVVRPLGHQALDEILQNWKSYTAHAANQLLGRSGPFWQRESYDHWIRDEAELAHCLRYTEDNPVKAGLCPVASEWEWSSARQ